MTGVPQHNRFPAAVQVPSGQHGDVMIARSLQLVGRTQFRHLGLRILAPIGGERSRARSPDKFARSQIVDRLLHTIENPLLQHLGVLVNAFSLLVVELPVMQRLEIPSHHGPGVCVGKTQRHLAPAQSAALLQRLTDGLR